MISCSLHSQDSSGLYSCFPWKCLLYKEQSFGNRKTGSACIQADNHNCILNAASMACTNVQGTDQLQLNMLTVCCINKNVYRNHDWMDDSIMPSSNFT